MKDKPKTSETVSVAFWGRRRPAAAAAAAARTDVSARCPAHAVRVERGGRRHGARRARARARPPAGTRRAEVFARGAAADAGCTGGS